MNNAADEALKNTNLKFVYVMATRGIQFKFLKYTIINRRDGTLTCENVSDSPTDGNGYITLDGNGYAVLKYCVEQTYIIPPTRDNAILPSQPLANNQFYCSQGATSGLSASQRLTGYPSAGSSSSAANRRPDTLDPNYDPRGSSRRDRRDDYATERPAARGSSRSSSGRESSSLTFHDVSNSVQRTSGSRGAPVRIYFTDRSGNVRETSESEWRMEDISRVGSSLCV